MISEIKAELFETSSKTGQNVGECLCEACMARDILRELVPRWVCCGLLYSLYLESSINGVPYFVNPWLQRTRWHACGLSLLPTEEG